MRILLPSDQSLRHRVHLFAELNSIHTDQLEYEFGDDDVVFEVGRAQAKS